MWANISGPYVNILVMSDFAWDMWTHVSLNLCLREGVWKAESRQRYHSPVHWVMESHAVEGSRGVVDCSCSALVCECIPRGTPLGTVESGTEVICRDVASCEMPFANVHGGLTADDLPLKLALVLVCLCKQCHHVTKVFGRKVVDEEPYVPLTSF
jgi:hypothetical protein